MEKDKQKTSRANSTRTKSERPKVWVPPSSLDAPPAPDGFRFVPKKSKMQVTIQFSKTGNTRE